MPSITCRVIWSPTKVQHLKLKSAPNRMKTSQSIFHMEIYDSYESLVSYKYGVQTKLVWKCFKVFTFSLLGHLALMTYWLIFNGMYQTRMSSRLHSPYLSYQYLLVCVCNWSTWMYVLDSSYECFANIFDSKKVTFSWVPTGPLFVLSWLK